MINEESFESKVRSFADRNDCKFNSDYSELTLDIKPGKLITTAQALCEEQDFLFDQLMDLAGIDYLDYGKTEWKTEQATETGFSRGVQQETFGRFKLTKLVMSPAVNVLVQHLSSPACDVQP